MREVLAELEAKDPCVSLAHESEWSLGAYQAACWCGRTWKTASRGT